MSQPGKEGEESLLGWGGGGASLARDRQPWASPTELSDRARAQALGDAGAASLPHCLSLPLPVLVFLLLLLAAALLLMYLHHHRYKGSYHTNEPKAIQDYNSAGSSVSSGSGGGGGGTSAPAAKPGASRKEQNLPQILEEAKTE